MNSLIRKCLVYAALYAQEILFYRNRRRTDINPILETLDNLGITSREKGKTLATAGIIEAMFGSGCLQKSFAEVMAAAENSSNTFANELSDTIIHKVAHKITDIPTENSDRGLFIGQYKSSKGRYFVKMDIKTGDKWIYTAFEEHAVKNGDITYYNI